MSIPKLYERSFNNKKFPVYVPGEEYSFYLNSDEPLTDPNFVNFRLNLIPCDSTREVIQNIGQLKKDGIDDLQYRIYCDSFIFPATEKGHYKFGIFDVDSQIYKAISNVFTVEETNKNTTLVRYRSPYDFMEFGYSRLPGFYNVFRLVLSIIDEQYESEKSQYRNVSNNKFRNYKSYRDKVVTVESYFFDEDTHEAMSAVYEHEEIILNGLVYIAKDAYQIEVAPDKKYKKGSINLYVDETGSGGMPDLRRMITVRLRSINGPVVMRVRPGQTVVVKSPYTTRYELHTDESVNEGSLTIGARAAIRLGSINGPVVMRARAGQTVVVKSPYSSGYKLYIE